MVEGLGDSQTPGGFSRRHGGPARMDDAPRQPPSHSPSLFASESVEPTHPFRPCPGATDNWLYNLL